MVSNTTNIKMANLEDFILISASRTRIGFNIAAKRCWYFVLTENLIHEQKNKPIEVKEVLVFFDSNDQRT